MLRIDLYINADSPEALHPLDYKSFEASCKRKQKS